MTGPGSPLDAVDWPAATAEALTHLQNLIRLDTTNPPGNERPAAEYLARALDREGIGYRIVESKPTRASLVARLPGSGKKRPLMLSGHLDVVPADKERWRHDPFCGEEHDGCIWGRGAIDMKNMVAMSLAVLVLLKRHGVPLERDVIFAAVADEEAGSRLGARFLVEQHPELVTAEYVLNEIGAYTLYFGDEIFYPIQIAEKGICWLELTTEGPPGHGSIPRPDSAVLKLAKAIDALGRTRLPQHGVPIVERFLERLSKSVSLPQAKAMGLLRRPRVSGALLDLMGRKDLDQAVALNALLRNTATPTVLSGGKKVNVIPSSASVLVDGRVLPGQRTEDFLDEVRRVVGRDVAVKVVERWEATVFDEKTPLFDTLCDALSRHHPGCVPLPFMIPGFTDSAAYARLGATCYGFSPVRMPPGLNYTRMYHGHDERVPVEGFAWGLRVLYDVVSGFCRDAA